MVLRPTIAQSVATASPKQEGLPVSGPAPYLASHVAAYPPGRIHRAVPSHKDRQNEVVVEDDSGRAAALYAAQEREPTCLPELDTLWAYRGIVVNLQVAAEIVLGRNKLVALMK